MLVLDRWRPAADVWHLLICLVVSILVMPVPSAAQTATPDQYTVRGVMVDVTAANAAEARDRAILDAQRKAFVSLYQQFNPQGTPPQLDNVQLQRVVRGFEVAQERVASDRYAASFSVTFRPDAVRSLLAASGVAAPRVSSAAPGAAQPAAAPPPRGGPFLIVPVTKTGERSVLFEERNPWRDAWEERAAGTTPVAVTVPAGELEDIAALAVTDALAGSAEGLRKLETRYRTDGAVVAVLQDAGGGAGRVLVTRYGNGRLLDRETIAVPAGDPQYLALVDQVLALVERAWRTGTMSNAPEQQLAVVAPLGSLEQWVELRKRLERQVSPGQSRLLSLSRTRAEFTLRHRGDVEILRETLSQGGLGLDASGPGTWLLSLATSTAPAVQSRPLDGSQPMLPSVMR